MCVGGGGVRFSPFVCAVVGSGGRRFFLLSLL